MVGSSSLGVGILLRLSQWALNTLKGEVRPERASEIGTGSE
jgi:hypothetical protein